jgi:hypothetical protein
MSLDYEDYLSNSSYLADNEARKDFGARLMLAFKQKNISESIQWYQAIHLHHRLRDWKVTFPEALGGIEKRVDIINMIYAGDIETATLSAIYGEADPMTSPEHWLSQERLNWVVAQMKAWLGWP